MFCTRVAWVCLVCLVCLLLCKEKCSSTVSLGLYEVPLYMSLVGFGMGTVGQLPYVWYYVGVMRSFLHTRGECESKRVYVFRCLMFSLSGPCELLFLLCFIASWN